MSLSARIFGRGDTAGDTAADTSDVWEEGPGPEEGEGPQPPSGRRRRIAVRILAVLMLLFVLLVAWLAWTAPLGKALEPLDTPALVLQAADGTPIARRGQYKGAPVDVEQLPDHVPNAFVAIEDQRFYSHFGIDPIGIGRALFANIEEGGVVQGGSTITQQLAKTSFLSADRSLKRKAQEALIALWLEAWLSKEEILSRYLSSVYYGDGAWGLRAAAMQYFSKDPEELTLGEAAMLAGLMKAPSRLAPTSNYEGARQRGRLVIAAMREQELIDEAEWNAARPAQMNPGRAGLPSGSYFADWIYPEAARTVGERYGEVEVRTTLDPQMQAAAQQILSRRIARSSATQGALVAMRPDGRVVAMVGGLDYSESAFNRAVQAKRQSGSAFKLFVYLAALREGLSPSSAVEDTPVTFGDWSPRNYDGEYSGEITLTEAFAQSSNVAAVRLAERVGVGDVQEAARDLGIDSELADDLTIALGTSEIPLLELTAAYAAVAAGGYPVPPYGIDRPGNPMADARRLRQQDELLTMLNRVVERGTGRSADLAMPSYGKTGTTQDYRDALFVGFIADLVVGVWVGNDDNSPMNGVTGSNVPADIWRQFVLEVSPEARAAEERRRRLEAVRAARDAEEERRRAEREGRGVFGDIEALIRGDTGAGQRLLDRVFRGEIDADAAADEIERRAERFAERRGQSEEAMEDFEEQWREALETYEERAREQAEQ